MKYAKLKDGQLYKAPSTLTVNGRVHYHPSSELYATHGYLPVINTPMPEIDEEDPVYYDFEWVEDNGRIVKRWFEADPPTPEIPKPTVEDRLTVVERRSSETAEAVEMILSGVTE